MRNLNNLLRSLILNIIDFFYPLFKNIFSLHTFRYAACGAANTLLDICLFYISYNYIIRKQNVHIAWLTISPHIASFLLSFFITFPTGFYLSRYVVFQRSLLRRRTQLTRYFQVVLGCMLLNYIFLKFFVEFIHWYPTPSKMISTGLIIIFSYLSQTHYSFKTEKAKLVKSGQIDTVDH